MAFAADPPPPATETPAAQLPAAPPPATEAPATPATETPVHPDPAPTTESPAVDAPSATDAPTTQVVPVLTATPAANLVNLQSIAIAGTGFSPNVTVGWAECKNGGTGAADCDVNDFGTTTTDSVGAFSASFTVHRILHTANGTVDCAAVMQGCRVGAAKLSDHAEFANTPLDFDPSVPLPPPPTLLAGPTTGLVEGQSVALFGGGFPGNSGVIFQQCVSAALTTCFPLGGMQADAGGNFITTVVVHRAVVEPPVSSTDCASAPGVCQIVAYAIVDGDVWASVPISFDAGGPLPAGTLTVTPDTDLVQFQSVTLTGAGFPAGVGAQIIECTTDATSFDECNQNGPGFATVGSAGTFSLPYSVRRILHLTSGDVDCATSPGACSLFASTYGGTSIVASAPVEFDAGVPVPPPPTITAAPDTDLVEGQSITVTGSAFPPGASIGLGECTTGGGAGGCGFGFGGFAVADGTGAFSATLVARRGIRSFATYPPTIVDCAGVPQACSVQAFVFDGGDTAEAPIDFDPTAPIATPTVTVAPQFGLADRALVAVHGEGYAPGDEVIVAQCEAGAAIFGPGCASRGYVTTRADPSGAIDVDVRVHRDLTYPDGGGPVLAGAVNCSDAVGACIVRAESSDEPLVTTDVPLGFDPTAVAPGPVITTTPTGPFGNGQQVVVHGSGFTPGAPLGLGECLAGVDPTGHTCDSRPGGLFDVFFADANGEFSRDRQRARAVPDDRRHGPLRHRVRRVRAPRREP